MNYLHQGSAGKYCKINKGRDFFGVVQLLWRQLSCRQASQPNQQTRVHYNLQASVCVGAEGDPDVVRSMLTFQLLDQVAI